MATRRRLSKHFTIEEFDCHDGTRVPDAAVAGLELAIEWWLEPMREMFGPVKVVSGYRTERFNSTLAGASPNSYHLYHRARPIVNHQGRPIRAVAFDVVPQGGTAALWSTWALGHRARSSHIGKKGRGGVGTYLKSNFVHLDTGPERQWNG